MRAQFAATGADTDEGLQSYSKRARGESQHRAEHFRYRAWHRSYEEEMLEMAETDEALCPQAKRGGLRVL